MISIVEKKSKSLMYTQLLTAFFKEWIPYSTTLLQIVTVFLNQTLFLDNWNYHSGMPLGFQTRVGRQLYGGHNLPSLVGIGLTETPYSGWAKNNPAHPLTESLQFLYNTYSLIRACVSRGCQQPMKYGTVISCAHRFFWGFTIWGSPQTTLTWRGG